MRILFFIISVALISCSSFLPARKISSQNQLPDQEQWQSFYTEARSVDLTSPEFQSEMKEGGTSVYLVIKKNQKKWGALIPENESAILSGEIAAFNLARLLGFSKIYQPVASYWWAGKNLDIFKSMIPATPYAGKWKELNRQNILKRIQNNPQGIEAIFKARRIHPDDYDALVDLESNKLNTSHTLKGSSVPFAQWLQCQGARPQSHIVTVNGGTNSEIELARDLSSVLLIDALTGQWDRFSGGNIQTAILDDGKVHFVANDNGGSWGGESFTQKTLALVSRYDEQMAQNILLLDGLLSGGKPAFGLANEAEFIEAMDLARYPKSADRIKKNARTVAEHLKRYQGCTF